ncbi:MAG TPA: multicopper oxidase domain-containing protein [Phototrophicaceae bacterium]|nr:multicopper oxidase domain-containing protein [Phototrophicaceae bacterium]
MQRREFLKLLGIGVGTAGIAGIVRPTQAQEMTDMPMPTAEPTQGVDWAAMDAHHKAGITTFLNNIGQDPHFWPDELQPTLDNGVKVFDLHCQETTWDTGGGTVFPALTYNGRVPGPTFRVDEGDSLRINVHNEMSQPTIIHWHGLLIPNKMDGVPYITQDPIMPGETFTYEFTARNPGSHMYHSHINSVEQVTRGMLGAFIITPKDTSREPVVQNDYVMILNDTTLGFTINGKGFPYTQPIVAKLGDKIRVRYMNEGLMIHPMHLHGVPQMVFAKDGYYLPTPYMADTVLVAPGERYDVLIDCTEPGVWAYHCHILSHAEGQMGMFGMVTALVINE